MPSGQNTKTENRSNVITNSIKTVKMVHIKKKSLKNNLKKKENHSEEQRFDLGILPEGNVGEQLGM